MVALLVRETHELNASALPFLGSLPLNLLDDIDPEEW
jgi:hypothetical protein